MKALVSIYSKDENIKLEDVVQDIRAGWDGDILNVHFRTTEKYIEDVYCSKGCIPKEDGLHKSLGIILSDATDSGWTYTIQLAFIVKCFYYSEVITPLKHEYFVSFIPHRHTINYDCLEDVEVEEWYE